MALTPCRVFWKGSPTMLASIWVLLTSNQGPEYWMLGFVSSISTKRDMNCDWDDSRETQALQVCTASIITWSSYSSCSWEFCHYLCRRLLSHDPESFLRLNDHRSSIILSTARNTHTPGYHPFSKICPDIQIKVIFPQELSGLVDLITNVERLRDL